MFTFGFCFFLIHNPFLLFIYLFLCLFIYLFIYGCLGLRCWVWAFSSSCGEPELLFIVVRTQASHWGGFLCCGARALVLWATVVVAHGLSSCGFQALDRRLSSCGAQA